MAGRGNLGMMRSNIAPLKFTLVSWIGHAELKAAAGEIAAGLGPTAQAK
jgi:hypothetical protein